MKNEYIKEIPIKILLTKKICFSGEIDYKACLVDNIAITGNGLTEESAMLDITGNIRIILKDYFPKGWDE